MKLDDSEKGRIRQVIADRCYPMVTGVDVHDVPADSDPATGYYLIFVPRSVQAPHAVRQRDPKPLWLCYPLRHGTTTHYLTETEIAARYRDRFALARGQMDRLERIHIDGRHNESRQGLAIAVGLVPAIPGNRPLTGDGPTTGHFVSRWQARRGELNGTALGNHRVARRRLRCGNDSVAVELYTDGAGWARHLGGSGIGQGELIVRADDLETYIVELLALLGGYAAWAGAAGDCAISVWLYGAVAVARGGGVGRVGLRPDRRQEEVLWVDGHLPEPAETTVPVDQLATRYGSRTRIGDERAARRTGRPSFMRSPRKVAAGCAGASAPQEGRQKARIGPVQQNATPSYGWIR